MRDDTIDATSSRRRSCYGPASASGRKHWPTESLPRGTSISPTHGCRSIVDALPGIWSTALNTAAHVADLVTLASTADEKAFEGFYTDPENHPGGTRKITIDDGTIGVFRQAWIDGGGGEGEPASYTLPALVKGDRIIADFSVPPKNAPASYAAFKGKRTERGIEWEDGNVWPKGQHKHQD